MFCAFQVVGGKRKKHLSFAGRTSNTLQHLEESSTNFKKFCQKIPAKGILLYLGRRGPA